MVIELRQVDDTGFEGFKRAVVWMNGNTDEP